MPDPQARLRDVHRAVAELRRGVPVLLTGDGADGACHLVAAAETLGARGLGLFAGAAAGLPYFLLAQSRAAAVLHRPVAEAVVAFRVAPQLLAPPLPSLPLLQGLADPTAEHMLPPGMDLVASAGEGPAPAAAIALAKLARLLPAALILRLTAEEARALAASAALLRVATAEVLAYPTDMAGSLTRVAEARVPLEAAENCRIVAFRPADGGIEHLAIVVGRPELSEAPLVRLHSECFTGDLLGSLKCDCGPQLKGAIAAMAEEGSGVLLYLAQEGRGIGLVNKLRAYELQDRGSDTLDANRQLGFGADERNFMVAAAMLEQVGIKRIRLMTNNPDKITALEACGVEIVDRVKHVFPTNGHNARYLATKAERFGHLLF
jgi:GTP cyclohydrolase II